MQETLEKGQAVKFSMKIWGRLFPYLKNVRKHIVAVLIFMLLSALTEASYPLFTSRAVNSFITPATTNGLLPFALVFLAFIVLEGVTVILFSRRSITIEMFMGRMLKRDCFVHLQQLPLSFYNTTSVGFLLARVMSDTDRISGMVAWGFAQVAWNICYIAGALIFMFTQSWRLALLLLAVIPLVLLVNWFFQRRILAVNRRVRAINARITGAYNEGITGAKASKTLVIEDLNVREFSAVTADMYRESVRGAMLTAIMLPLVLFCGSIAVGAVLYRGGILVMDQLMDFGILSAFISYAVGIVEPVVQTAAIFTDMVSAQVGIERVTALMDAPLTITDTPGVAEKYGDVFNPKRENWEKLSGDITFENVWFKYPDGNEFILEDFSLHIPAGTTVAIVGETGAGKSTLVNLACRFFEPTKGRVLIDGRDYRERSQLWLHSALGYVLQDPHLFSGTVMENIRYGRLEATDAEVVAAARLVSADVVAAKLPDGYATQVGEGGDRLSTGEKQLVSFARAVLADPPIFVLDEATSSIDTETELLIQNAISHILNGRTSFIIAHRLSTIRRADIILVVDDGKIVERGTHEELMAKGGRYAALCRAMALEQNEDVV
ncbi:ATP-binding cassette, subfamily B [Sporobacter termitidis DSM 10068]|uniref:ATP-binding cassette, subfamily B n=1 Tax=Sporobacter termitidis DSM 10068 TaxID=1123282 RepID=A0A1M5UQG6_9FIRM|nr:ABC transporter ATP-binding protein [Sporobacter termitidis]SHH65199.1 ATP-binding cassette, subfamily B [Sporobacter termitidis DSM 10068]